MNIESAMGGGDYINPYARHHLRGRYFDGYAQHARTEGQNQVMDAVVKMVVNDPHDLNAVGAVVERIKGLWQDGDTVGSLMARYRREERRAAEIEEGPAKAA